MHNSIIIPHGHCNDINLLKQYGCYSKECGAGYESNAILRQLSFINKFFAHVMQGLNDTIGLNLTSTVTYHLSPISF